MLVRQLKRLLDYWFLYQPHTDRLGTNRNALHLAINDGSDLLQIRLELATCYARFLGAHAAQVLLLAARCHAIAHPRFLTGIETLSAHSIYSRL